MFLYLKLVWRRTPRVLACIEYATHGTAQCISNTGNGASQSSFHPDIYYGASGSWGSGADLTREWLWLGPSEATNQSQRPLGHVSLQSLVSVGMALLQPPRMTIFTSWTIQTCNLIPFKTARRELSCKRAVSLNPCASNAAHWGWEQRIFQS